MPPMSIQRRSQAGLLLTGLCVLFVCGCSGGPREPENAKNTVKVSGKVTLDGEPGWGVKITLHPKDGGDEADRTFSSAEGDQEGNFIVKTYGVDDGAPPGDYTLTFEKFDRSKIIIGGGGNGDGFQGALSDPAKSTFKLTVPEDGPYEADPIELVSP